MNLEETLRAKMKEMTDTVDTLSKEEIVKLHYFFNDLEGFAYSYMDYPNNQ